MDAKGFTEKELNRFFLKESGVLDICTYKDDLLEKINERIEEKMKEARQEVMKELVALNDIEISEFEQYKIWMEYIKENLHN